MLRRVVLCEGSDGTVLDTNDDTQLAQATDAERCGAAADGAPASTYDCPATPHCTAFRWMAAAFPAPCPGPKLCGQAERVSTRQVACHGDDGADYADDKCHGATAAAKPDQQQVCPATADCVEYMWVAHPAQFPACPSACGVEESLQTRVVECRGSDGSVLADRAAAAFNCTSAPPTAQRPCAPTPKCGDWVWQDTGDEFSWQAAEFPACGTGCGLSAQVQRRQVACIRGGGDQPEEVSADHCAEVAPAAVRACEATALCQLQAPPPPPPMPVWQPPPPPPPPPPPAQHSRRRSHRHSIPEPSTEVPGDLSFTAFFIGLLLFLCCIGGTVIQLSEDGGPDGSGRVRLYALFMLFCSVFIPLSLFCCAKNDEFGRRRAHFHSSSSTKTPVWVTSAPHAGKPPGTIYRAIRHHNCLIEMLRGRRGWVTAAAGARRACQVQVKVMRAVDLCARLGGIVLKCQ